MDTNGTSNMDNPSNTTNTTINVELSPIQKILYLYMIPLMFILCIISIVVNIRVLISAFWIKRPISPTLHISLSLAGADACTSFLLCIGLLINSYLPQFDVKVACYYQVFVEVLRLSGVIITVIHLLALSMHHWLGILKPLHYTSMITQGKIALLTLVLWLSPVGFFASYFAATCEIVEWNEHGCGHVNFTNNTNFRYIFALLFFVPMLLMIFFYTHILIIVKKHQKEWARLSRTGSTRYRGMNGNNGNNAQQRRRTMEGNVKAVYTTLLILGSCLIGWLPAVFALLLFCDDCVFSDSSEIDQIMLFIIAWVTNTLVILKTLANPIIYLARMIEIKEGTKRMKLALRRTFCSVNSHERYALSENHPKIIRTTSLNAGMTAFGNVNGTFPTRRSLRSNYPNTPV